MSLSLYMFLLNVGLMCISSQPVVFLCMRVLVVVWRPVLMDSLVMEVPPLSLEHVIHVSPYNTH
jgi:hypothetical protein